MNDGVQALQKVSRLTLGTAALGLSYGVANRDGVVSDVIATMILERALHCKISCFDTASAYGLSEQRLGKWMKTTGARPQLISKLPPIDSVDANAHETVALHLASSLQALGVAALDGYLVHSASDFLRSDVRDALVNAREDGKVGAIGVSAYEPDQIFSALETGQANLVQVPVNLVDRRMVQSGAIAACRESGVTVFARSAFLQGALLMKPNELPSHLNGLCPVLTALHATADRHGVSAIDLLLGVVLTQREIDSVVVGVHSVAQLEQQLQVLSNDGDDDAMSELENEVDAIVSNLPKQLLDPRAWPPNRR
ncbi:MAG: aldo/keto reductase [Pseudomonadota bacterium]